MPGVRGPEPARGRMLAVRAVSAPFGIRVRVCGVRVWTGYAFHRYAFASPGHAWEFANDHWAQFSARWRRKHLSVAPLPPFITVPGSYLMHTKEGD
jgi:hypothetical protein